MRIQANADLGLLTSHQEGFSNALLELMAAGLPVVATDVGGNREAVVDGETGVLVPPRSSSLLAEAIVDLAGDPGARNRFGAAGRRRVSHEFSLQTCVEHYDQQVRNIVSSAEPQHFRSDAASACEQRELSSVCARVDSIVTSDAKQTPILRQLLVGNTERLNEVSMTFVRYEIGDDHHQEYFIAQTKLGTNLRPSTIPIEAIGIDGPVDQTQLPRGHPFVVV